MLWCGSVWRGEIVPGGPNQAFSIGEEGGGGVRGEGAGDEEEEEEGSEVVEGMSM